MQNQNSSMEQMTLHRATESEFLSKHNFFHLVFFYFLNIQEHLPNAQNELYFFLHFYNLVYFLFHRIEHNFLHVLYGFAVHFYKVQLLKIMPHQDIISFDSKTNITHLFLLVISFRIPCKISSLMVRLKSTFFVLPFCL